MGLLTVTVKTGTVPAHRATEAAENTRNRAGLTDVIFRLSQSKLHDLSATTALVALATTAELANPGALKRPRARE